MQLLKVYNVMGIKFTYNLINTFLIDMKSCFNPYSLLFEHNR